MNVIFLGPPGSGKGTQAQRICLALNVPQISTGDILRRAIKEQTKTGLEAKSYIDAGKLVPDDVVIAIVKERLAQDDCKKGYVLDGFPRTIAQAEALDKIAHIDVVMNLDISDEKLVARLSGRRVCLKCGATYHESRLNGATKCAACNDSIVQRDDDKPETVLNRLSVYHAQSAPLVSYYGDKGLLKTIDGTMGMDEIFNTIMKTLED